MTGEGVIRSPIKEFGSGRMGVGAGGKPSITRYRHLRTLRAGILLEVEPLTAAATRSESTCIRSATPSLVILCTE